MTAAATWILNPYTRLAINYVDTTFDDGAVTVKDISSNVIAKVSGEKAITLRGQFDF